MCQATAQTIAQPLDDAVDFRRLKWTDNVRPAGPTTSAEVLTVFEAVRADVTAEAVVNLDRWTLADAPPPYKGGPLSERIDSILARGAAKRQQALLAAAKQLAAAMEWPRANAVKSAHERLQAAIADCERP